MDNLSEILPVIAVVIGALLTAAAAIVKLTPSSKDDEVVDKIKEIADPIVDALDGDDKDSAA